MVKVLLAGPEIGSYIKNPNYPHEMLNLGFKGLSDSVIEEFKDRAKGVVSGQHELFNDGKGYKVVEVEMSEEFLAKLLNMEYGKFSKKVGEILKEYGELSNIEQQLAA